MKIRAIVGEVVFWSFGVLSFLGILAIIAHLKREPEVCPVCPEVRECTLPEVIDLGVIEMFDFQGSLIRRKSDGDEEKG